MAFVSSSSNNTSSTNKAVNTARVVSTASTQVNVANSTNIDNLSDAVICAFFASQPNSPQLVNEDFHMLKSFNMEDLEDLYKLVKSKFKSTRPVEDLDLLLWGDLKTMFEPHVEDESTFLEDATCADSYVGRKEVSPYTIYTFNDVGKEAYN
ncbi:hypothetical protein Tco_1249529 [Tanacetum coccineum]